MPNTFGDIQSATPEEERKYYVYMWYEEVGDKIAPVYVGMGSGNRWRTRSGRSKIVSEYLKSHNCKPQMLVENLALIVAYELEEKIKVKMVERGIELLDAEHDLNERKRRQREGIDAMPVVNGKRFSTKTGNACGRPRRNIDGFEKIAEKQKRGQISVTEACKQLGISRTQWYRMAKEVIA
jgi:hypothetical protein